MHLLIACCIQAPKSEATSTAKHAHSLYPKAAWRAWILEGKVFQASQEPAGCWLLGYVWIKGPSEVAPPLVSLEETPLGIAPCLQLLTFMQWGKWIPSGGSQWTAVTPKACDSEGGGLCSKPWHS